MRHEDEKSRFLICAAARRGYRWYYSLPGGRFFNIVVVFIKYSLVFTKYPFALLCKLDQRQWCFDHSAKLADFTGPTKMKLPNSILHEHDQSCPAEELELPHRASNFSLYGVGRADSSVIHVQQIPSTHFVVSHRQHSRNTFHPSPQNTVFSLCLRPPPFHYPSLPRPLDHHWEADDEECRLCAVWRYL